VIRAPNLQSISAAPAAPQRWTYKKATEWVAAGPPGCVDLAATFSHEWWSQKSGDKHKQSKQVCGPMNGQTVRHRQHPSGQIYHQVELVASRMGSPWIGDAAGQQTCDPSPAKNGFGTDLNRIATGLASGPASGYAPVAALCGPALDLAVHFKAAPSPSARTRHSGRALRERATIFLRLKSATIIRLLRHALFRAVQGCISLRRAAVLG